MKFETYTPQDRLKPFVRHYSISENESESTYKVFPSSGLVLGFQYRGKLSNVFKNQEKILASAGITGISTEYKVFKNAANIGSVLVFFTEIGFAHFTKYPIHELFQLSLSLDVIFDKHQVENVEEKLNQASDDKQRIHVVERFLLHQLQEKKVDQLVVEAVQLIYQSKGTIRISELTKTLCISASPFEKRFRQVVGTSAKKFASIVRFNAVLNELKKPKSLIEICYENHFFDQAHFIKDFKQFTGETPEQFKRLL